MAKCKWCHSAGPVNSIGWCDGCYRMIRGNIKNCRATLAALLEESKHQPVADRAALIRKANECYSELLKYYKADVVFYQTYKDDLATYRQICKNVNFDPNPVATLYRRVAIAVGAAFAVFMIFCIGTLALMPKPEPRTAEDNVRTLVINATADKLGTGENLDWPELNGWSITQEQLGTYRASTHVTVNPTGQVVVVTAVCFNDTATDEWHVNTLNFGDIPLIG